MLQICLFVMAINKYLVMLDVWYLQCIESIDFCECGQALRKALTNYWC